ncbi:HNH endonuclease signature motif containing protein [Streptomyces virginiae]|uniref:HNH endonuclease n=1 Tax=Streptomyces virginiae TaxID=1961 RepID=UPI002E28CED6|nr:HNH endonuclease signature motif containing protein [Streptomyces virginiae]
MDVDHVRPLSLGGEDTDGNVHVLCHDCHQLKTSAEFGGASTCPGSETPTGTYRRCIGTNTRQDLGVKAPPY